MARLQSSLSGGAASAVSEPRLLDRDLDDMTDEEIDEALRVLAGSRTMSQGASKRPGAAKTPKAPEEEMDI